MRVFLPPKREARDRCAFYPYWHLHRDASERDLLTVPRNKIVSFVDLERGIFYRKLIGKRATKKRQTPAPAPPRLLAHMRRWVRLKLIAERFVEFNGKPVASVDRGFKSSVGLAWLWQGDAATPPAPLAATELVQRGVPV